MSKDSSISHDDTGMPHIHHQLDLMCRTLRKALVLKSDCKYDKKHYRCVGEEVRGSCHAIILEKTTYLWEKADFLESECNLLKKKINKEQRENKQEITILK